MKTILVVGGAGSGKTWVMEQVIKKFRLTRLGRVGMFLFHQNDKYCVLGKYDGSTFQGSDKLSMAVMRDLDAFKTVKKDYVVICEGDRFMNSTFISKTKPFIIKITNDGSQGRAQRGSNQTERQIKTIQTRVQNVAAHVEVPNSDIALKRVILELQKIT